jgi:hypothetical protein
MVPENAMRLNACAQRRSAHRERMLLRPEKARNAIDAIALLKRP